jgi:hypothetical protein
VGVQATSTIAAAMPTAARRFEMGVVLRMVPIVPLQWTSAHVLCGVL